MQIIEYLFGEDIYKRENSMNKIIFSVLFVFISLSCVHAQEKPEAYKFFEYGKISSELLNEKYREFHLKTKNEDDVKKDNGSTGYIINCGTAQEIV